MKLLIDENLSQKLVVQLADLFPGSVHVRDIGLARASDPIVWQYALERGLRIVSKDEDFHHLSFFAGLTSKGDRDKYRKLFDEDRVAVAPGSVQAD